MKKTKRVWLLLALCGSFTWSFAESAAAERLSLSLQEAQQIALEHNRKLKNASHDVKKAEANRWQTIASMLPQVNASFDYSDRLGYQIDLGAQRIAMNPSGTFALSAAIGISGAQIVATQIGSISTKMADITLQQTEQQITDQVKSLYYSALTMGQMAKLLEENSKNIEAMHKTTLRSVEVGVAEQTDADQLSVQVATIQSSVSATKRAEEMVYNSMRLQLGISVDTEITLTQNVEELVNVERALALLGEDFNLENNYNYQLLKQNTELSKKQVRSAEWAYGPTLSAVYQYSKITFFGQDSGFNMTAPNMLGISVSLPIFSSGKNFEGVRAAKLDYKKQLNTLADTEDALRIEHRQLRYNLSSAYETYETQKKNLEVVQRVFKNTSLKYGQGVASSFELTTASNNMITAQNSYIQALMEFVTAQINLEQLLNKQ